MFGIDLHDKICIIWVQMDQEICFVLAEIRLMEWEFSRKYIHENWDFSFTSTWAIFRIKWRKVIWGRLYI